ncbi:MAG: hypothetical protein KGD64_14120, partial [Candidatus Heimdallarchaeota archaeon]|nr:hypothetical protein [Candidatus Heimdallarchaeota archaeon]
ILSKSDTNVTYGENFQIYISLTNEWLQYQTINSIKVDDTEIITDLYFNLTTMECVFNLSSVYFTAKGNYSISIRAESLYYYGNNSTETLFDLEVKPILVLLVVWVLNTTIQEGTPVIIYANFTLTDGTPIVGVEIYFIIYIYLKNNTELPPTVIKMSFADYNGTDDTESRITGSNGIAILSYTLNYSISSIEIEAGYVGDATRDQIKFRYDGIVITFPPPEAEKLPNWLLGLIIGGSILIAGIISFIIYKATRPKPFEDLMKKVTDEEIALNYSILSPGIMLSIFDQRKGPIPLVTDHSLNIGRYLGRMQIGIENFLLKIADQAYSSLGFEEHTDERRVGSIVLPSEKMIGFLQGIQIKNPQARGGFENLSLIVLADRDYGNLLLNYQEYLYPKIDELDAALKGKESLKKVEELIKQIRITSVVIILAAQQVEKAQEDGNNS